MRHWIDLGRYSDVAASKRPTADEGRVEGLGGLGGGRAAGQAGGHDHGDQGDQGAHSVVRPGKSRGGGGGGERDAEETSPLLVND